MRNPNKSPALAAAAAALLVMAGCGPDAAGPPPPPEVGVVTLASRAIEITDELPGRTTAFRARAPK
jgi:membrane fusion protein (multidrug efflux system)